MSDHRLMPLVPPIVLLGPPGAGKSTLGPKLAARLGFSFVSLDERAQADRFVIDGELRFRLREHHALAAALHDAPGGAVVIDAGAGIVDLEENRALLARALCLVVDVDLPTSLSRLQRASSLRPWLVGTDDPLGVLRAREAGRDAHRAQLVALTHGRSLDGRHSTDDVLGAALVAVRSSRLPRADDVDVVSVFDALGGIAGRAFVVADAHVVDVISASGVTVDLALSLRPVDKRLALVEQILGAFVKAGVSRQDTILAIGGGLLLDVVGLAAALHHRGTPWRAVPTTLLAMIDAAMGGKTAVDVELDVDVDLDRGATGRLRVRNAAGALHAPRTTHVWPGFLRTLGSDELRQGRAELLKHALLVDDDLDEAVCCPLDREHIARSRGIKRAVVERDPTERHLRHALNLGHTIGHGLESVVDIAHGDAVLHGLRAMLWLSQRCVALDDESAARARAAIATLAPPPLPVLSSTQRESIVAACRRDKKNGRFVLLRALGEPVLFDVDEDLVRAAVVALG